MSLRPVQVRWLLAASCALLIVCGAAALVVRPHATPASLANLTGLPLPTGISAIETETRWFFIGDYEAFVRFEVDPQDLQLFLSHPTFQPLRQGRDPYAAFENAAQGNQLVVHQVAARRPAWWDPQAGRDYILAYRSFSGP